MMAASIIEIRALASPSPTSPARVRSLNAAQSPDAARCNPQRQGAPRDRYSLIPSAYV